MSKTLATQRSLKFPKGNTKHRMDLTGQRFGRLVVLRYLPTHKIRGAYWLCRCDCGNEKAVKSQHLRSGHIKSCRCMNAELCAAACRRNAAKKFDPTTNGPKAVFSVYRFQSRKRGLEFTLKLDEFTALITRNCFYCGAPPSNEHFNRSGIRPFKFKYSGLDRRDNTKGYNAENCLPCCIVCNRAKLDLTFEQFLAWVTRVHGRHSG